MVKQQRKQKSGISQALYEVDEAFLLNIKMLITEGGQGGKDATAVGDKRKLYLGFVICSVLLDMQIVNINTHFDFLHKSVLGPLLVSVSSTLGKNDVLSEMACVATKTLI